MSRRLSVAERRVVLVAALIAAALTLYNLSLRGLL